MELVLQDLEGFGQSNDSFDVDSLGGDDPVPHDRLSWQLIDTSHSGWCIYLDIFGGEQVLYLKVVLVYQYNMFISHGSWGFRL